MGILLQLHHTLLYLYFFIFSSFKNKSNQRSACVCFYASMIFFVPKIWEYSFFMSISRYKFDPSFPNKFKYSTKIELIWL